MRKAVKKSLIITGATIGGLVIIILAAGAFLVTTQTGLEFILAHAGDKIQVASVEGSLLSPFTLKDVTLETDSASVHVNRLTAQWSPGALFEGSLDIHRLTLAGVDVYRHPASEKQPASTGPPRLKPPIDVNIDTLELDHAVVHGASDESQPLTIDSARLSGTFTDEKLAVRHIEAHGPRFDLAGGAHLSPAGDYATAGEIQFALRLPDYAPATGTIQLGGSLRALKLVATIASPYNTRATLNADALAEPIEMDAQVTVDAMALHEARSTWPTIVLNAKANADGTPKNLQYRLRGHLDGEAIGGIDIALDGNLKNKIATIGNLAVTRPDNPATLHAAGTINTGGETPKLALNLDWRALQYPLTGPPKITLPQGRAKLKGTLKQLQASWQTAIGEQGHIRGAVERQGEQFGVNATWKKLGNGKITSPGGKLNFGGSLSQYRLKITAQMSAPGQTHGHLLVRGNGDRDSIAIDKIDFKALQGELTGHAKARWKPALNSQIHLDGHGINPGLVVDGWPGSLGLKLDAHVAREDDNLTASVDTMKIDGKLRGYSVGLNAALDYVDKVLELHRFTLQSGPSTLSAHGQAGQSLNLEWKIDSPDLASLYPNAEGSLKGAGKISGPRKRPHIVAQLHGAHLKALLQGSEYAFKSLDIDADLALQGEQQSHLKLALNDGTAGKINIHSVKLTGQGTLAHHRLTLSADTNRGGVDIAATGGLRNQRWRFTLNKATLSYPQLAPWQLVQPSGGYLGKKIFALNKTCWRTTGRAEACVQAKRNHSKLAGAFKLSDLEWAYFQAITPPGVGATGTLSAQGDFERDGQNSIPSVHVTANTSKTVLLDTPQNDMGDKQSSEPPRQVMAFAPSQLKLDMDSSGLQLGAALKLLKQQGGLFLTAKVPGGEKPLTKRPLHAKLRSEIPDIGFVSRLNPSVGEIDGRLEGTMHVRGTLAAPELRGRIALNDGSAQLPEPGLELTDVQLTLNGLPGGGLSISGNASSGGGTISIDGKANLVAEPRRANIIISGADFQALGNSLGTAYISPDLKIALRGQTLNVTGKVEIPKANLTPTQIPTSAVGVSGDQVIIRPGEETSAPLKQHLNADIHLVLGEDVHFNGFGLTTDITGNLEILEQGNNPTRASGELNLVNGEYRAYGQGLVIEQGTLLFAGPVTEPGLDIRALRHPAENITVGVSISGTLKHPKFELFSKPPMTQAEKLSWLVLGRPLDDTSDQQGSALSRLALSLGITQSNKIAKNLGESLGLDTFSIKTGSGEAGAASNVYEAALVIGKYLSPRLYVSYGIGLLEPVNTVRLEYTLSSRWKLVTESSSIASGGDLIYTLESQ